MAEAALKMTDKDAIRALIDEWVRAAKAADIEAVMACYTNDIRAFDAIAKLEFRGMEAYRAHWKMCMEMMPGAEMIMDVHDLEVEQNGDLAFVHYLSLCGCTDEKGEAQTGWMRATVCCRKTDKGWKIAHEHYSSPFDPETMEIINTR
ncbi:YybH family protein [Tepidicaulis sp. LMO-SS28]|uniref:YybH family protein n=1 Tax=Tepidicaulis sp. LMO-SS28 TaxID=3447455 RepID=UPI003EE0A307